MSDEIRIGRTIRSLRRYAGLSVDELAVRAGVSAASLRAIEDGDAVPSVIVVSRIARAASAALETGSANGD